MGRPGRLVRWKPLHFVLLASLAWFAGSGLERHERSEPLRLDAAREQALASSWQAEMGRAPTPAELRDLVARELDDEILFREARARALHEIDPVVRQRLLLNMRFLGTSGGESEEDLFRQALALGMDANDLVVRRRLIQVMELSIEDSADKSPATPGELQAAYAQAREALTVPARWRISQVYFSSDRRAGVAREAADAALVTIARDGLEPDAAVRLGDPFLGGHRLPLLSLAQLAGQFGNSFAAALPACAPAAWCGPVESSYGWHLVHIDASEPQRLPAIDDPEVQKRLLADVQRARGERVLAETLARLRKRYGVAS